MFVDVIRNTYGLVKLVSLSDARRSSSESRIMMTGSLRNIRQINRQEMMTSLPFLTARTRLDGLFLFNVDIVDLAILLLLSVVDISRVPQLDDGVVRQLCYSAFPAKTTSVMSLEIQVNE